MKLINLVHATPLVKHDIVDYVNYIQLDINDSDLVNTYLHSISKSKNPVFIVGYNLAKKIYGIRVNPLDKQIKENDIMWEFAYEENRSDHIEGVFEVINRRIFNIKFHNIQYNLVDPIFSNIRQEHEISKINPIECLYVYKDMVYGFNKEVSTIYGLDLNTFDFFGFNREALLYALTSQCKNVKLDLEGDTFVEYKLRFPFADNLKRSIVLLLQDASE
jgi:hypothetical protein